MTFDPCPALHAAVKEGDVETAVQLIVDDGKLRGWIIDGWY